MTRRSPDEIAQALSHVPAHDRETWVLMAMALKSELGDSGFDLWKDWSQSDDTYKDRDAKAVWRSVRQGGRIGIGTLFFEAQQRGFRFNGKGKPYDAAEMERLRAERDERMRLEEIERAEWQEKAAKLAEEIYNAATPAQSHPYLEKKGVTAAPGVRVGRWYQVGEDGKRYREKENCLLIPIRDEGGKLWNLQAIFPAADAEIERDRDYLSGGRKQGCYFAIGKPQGVVVVAEGYATARSVNMATGHAVCVAFDKGNLVPVMKSLRAKMPDARLIAAADNDIKADKPNYGLEKAWEAAVEVSGLITVPELDGQKCDFNDVHMKRGVEAVKAAIQEARPAAPKEEENGEANVISNEEQHDVNWPAPLAEEAFHGLVGEIVRSIEPETESDEAAILLQSLVTFGALVGRGAHVKVEGDEHHAVLFGLIVGDTAKARKGTSHGRVREIFSAVNRYPEVIHGLSSGEGVKFAVRDPIYKPTSDGPALIDQGVSDKRLLVVESEFAQVLRQCSRAGNTLSTVLRCIWDGQKLQTLTRTDPITATGHHIGIIGHITADELRSELTQTDSANGFANRFIFMCSKRSKYLPFGGKPMSADLISQFARRIESSVDKAKSRFDGAIQMDSAAKEVWAKVYQGLSEGQLGMVGAVTARAEAQCLRLALVYALLDEADHIGVEHVMAGLAVWQRASDSAQAIWRTAIGDPRADAIYRALLAAGANGVRRTDISALFNRHESAERIAAALQLLKSRGLAICETEPTTGRHTEVWYAATAKKANKAKEALLPPAYRRLGMM
jgi:phage/plasmid primase-like uncharacterized protein